jgi:hypothetical protein
LRDVDKRKICDEKLLEKKNKLSFFGWLYRENNMQNIFFLGWRQLRERDRGGILSLLRFILSRCCFYLHKKEIAILLLKLQSWKYSTYQINVPKREVLSLEDLINPDGTNLCSNNVYREIEIGRKLKFELFLCSLLFEEGFFFHFRIFSANREKLKVTEAGRESQETHSCSVDFLQLKNVG